MTDEASEGGVDGLGGHDPLVSKELTVRERTFLDAKLEGASHAEAARQAGYGNRTRHRRT